ncbi:hypothetical protein ACNI65_24285 [Roseateles sp. So40a]|uniref:hypothetical protein n=1 Tax=Roseateles sp. So40a TaxID=3400226 RepID=UPI003A86E8F2
MTLDLAARQVQACLGAGPVQLRQVQQLRRRRSGVDELERARRRAVDLASPRAGRGGCGRFSGPLGAWICAGWDQCLRSS